jgi:hypothetical protein
MLRVDLRRFWTNSLVDETVILNASTRKESFAEASRLLFDTLMQAGVDEGVWVSQR